MLYLGDEFVVTDIETTALSPEKGGMIIEIGAVKVKGTEIVDTFSSLINPERKIYSKTIEITGITNEMLQGQPVYGQVLPEFYRFLGNAIFVAHNSEFDWDRYLMYFLPKVGIFPTNKVIDTLALSRLYFPNNEKHTLDVMCEMFHIPLKNHHRALDDAMATARLLIEYKRNFATKLINPSFTFESEQLDLFNLALNEANVTTKTPINVETVDTQESKENTKKNYKIKRVKYWEKQVNRNKCFRRIYVLLPEGNAYFDIHTKTWYNKDIKESVDFEVLSESVLRYLNLNTVDELCNFRN